MLALANGSGRIGTLEGNEGVLWEEKRRVRHYM